MSFFRKQEKEKIKELENRARQFLGEYGAIRRRYQCDFQAFLKFKDGGEGGISAGLRVVDATEVVKAEEEMEKKIQGEAEKKRLEANQNQEKKNGS